MRSKKGFRLSLQMVVILILVVLAVSLAIGALTKMSGVMRLGG